MSDDKIKMILTRVETSDTDNTLILTSDTPGAEPEIESSFMFNPSSEQSVHRAEGWIVGIIEGLRIAAQWSVDEMDVPTYDHQKEIMTNLTRSSLDSLEASQEGEIEPK